MDNNAKNLYHARAALQHIARTCKDPDTAQFASRAAENPPSAFAPDEDYESVTGVEYEGDGTIRVNEKHYTAMMTSLMALVGEKGGYAYIDSASIPAFQGFGLYLKGAGDSRGWIVELQPEGNVSKA